MNLKRIILTLLSVTLTSSLFLLSVSADTITLPEQGSVIEKENIVEENLISDSQITFFEAIQISNNLPTDFHSFGFTTVLDEELPHDLTFYEFMEEIDFGFHKDNFFVYMPVEIDEHEIFAPFMTILCGGCSSFVYLSIVNEWCTVMSNPPFRPTMCQGHWIASQGTGPCGTVNSRTQVYSSCGRLWN